MNFHVFFLTGLLFFALSSPSGFAAEADKAQKAQILENFDKVDDNLYRGAQPDKNGFKELKKMGIKSIVNLRYAHSDKKIFDEQDFKYFQIPMKPAVTIDEDVAAFLKIMSDKDNYPVFLHCHAGADRTGVMVAAYRMYFQGWTSRQALEELPKHNFHPEWINIPEYIKKFDKEKIRKIIEDKK